MGLLSNNVPIGTAGVMTGLACPATSGPDSPIGRRAGSPDWESPMGFAEFYWACIRRASKASWAVIGTISTLATFAVPGAAKLFGIADQETLNTILFAAPVVAIRSEERRVGKECRL